MATDLMNKFEFLLGDWNLEYRIPKSAFSEARSDSGVGSFTRMFDDKFVVFDYTTKSGGAAKGIFARDEKLNMYRYWWFENSGAYQTATCDFISDDVLAMNWHDTLFVQTFTKVGPDRVVLRMQQPAIGGEYETILEVLFTKK